MAKIESKIGKIPHDSEKIYTFISDFNNFKNFVPADKVESFESTQDSCRFSLPGMGQAGLEITEKQPNKLIKVISDASSPIKLTLWIQIKETDPENSAVKVTVEPEVNQMMMMMVKKPLKNFADKLIDQMEQFPFENH
jgi:carbon monoxide dehydrogenase subunit G